MNKPEIQFDEHGWSYEGFHQIHYAARKGDVKQLKALIDKGNVSVDLETKTNLRMISLRITPLQDAATRGKTEAVRLLLDCKANIDKQDSNGWTALVRAVWARSKDCVQLLLQHKANRTLLITSGMYKGLTALDLAKRSRRNEEIVTMLEAQPAPEAPPAPFPMTVELS